MRRNPVKRIAAAAYFVLLSAALTALVWTSLTDRFAPASHEEKPRTLTGVTAQIGDTEAGPVTLPLQIDGLAPRTSVTLTVRTDAKPGESLLIKSVFAPMRLYINGTLALEAGQEGSYPAYMNDPPTLLTTVKLTDTAETVEIRVEYLSPTQRGTLSLPKLTVGNEAAILATQFEAEGPSLLFSLVLLFLGVILILVSLAVVGQNTSGAPFLWLGLFSLSAGIWVMGECDLTALLLPYPVLLYNMAYMGLFLVVIPLLQFGLITLNPISRLPLRIMLTVHYVSVAAAIILHFTGTMDFIKSLFWFHIIAPLGFITLAGSILWEHFRHRNPAAKRFAPAVILLAASTVLEVLNYWLRLTGGLTVFFQFGVLAFVVSLAVVSGFYVTHRFLKTAEEKTRLEYEMATAARQLTLQRLQYHKMAENEAAVKSQRHDLRHHLAVLRELSESDNREKFRGYIDSLIRQIPSDKETRLCENYAVNAVAVYYKDLAETHHIRCELKFAVPAELPQTIEIDLCVIIGNLLENAYEACERMTIEERFIRLNSSFEYGTLTVTVDNSFDGTLREKDDVFLSSKREGEGLGLSSVAAVAKKYKGAAKFEAKDGVFEASVYVRLDKES